MNYIIYLTNTKPPNGVVLLCNSIGTTEILKDLLSTLMDENPYQRMSVLFYYRVARCYKAVLIEQKKDRLESGLLRF